MIEKKAIVSVMIEGYNESIELGLADETLEALKRQDLPPDQVEVILVGTLAQVQTWSARYPMATPFSSIQFIPADGAHYYDLKNRGALSATASILAFTDSDARPEAQWLSTIVSGIQNGSPTVAGLSLFATPGLDDSDRLIHQVAASISWGSVVGKRSLDGVPLAEQFRSHNLGIRADVFRKTHFRTDLGRTNAGWFLFKALRESNVFVTLQARQRIAHRFTFSWWAFRLHPRFGHELYNARRLDESWPHRWVKRTWILEPALTMLWHLALEIPSWFRFSQLLGMKRARQWLALPVLIGMSLIARSAEMIGMYATMVAPQAMKRFADRN